MACTPSSAESTASTTQVPPKATSLHDDDVSVAKTETCGVRLGGGQLTRRNRIRCSVWSTRMTKIRSRLANSVSQPAAASAATTVRPRTSSYEPGVRTSPTMFTRTGAVLHDRHRHLGLDQQVLQALLDIARYRGGGSTFDVIVPSVGCR